MFQSHPAVDENVHTVVHDIVMKETLMPGTLSNQLQDSQALHREAQAKTAAYAYYMIRVCAKYP